jgi:hypothetical protein
MNESLLPTRMVLQGGEVLRIVGPDGRPMRLPLTALLDAAEARFATRTAEAGLLADCWRAIYANRDDLAVLTARTLVLEAKPPVSIAGLATQASVTALAANVTALAANVTALVASVTALTARVGTLESEIKTKKDK